MEDRTLKIAAAKAKLKAYQNKKNSSQPETENIPPPITPAIGTLPQMSTTMSSPVSQVESQKLTIQLLVNEKSELMREVKRLSQLVESLNVEKQNHFLEMSAHHRTVRQLEKEIHDLKLEHEGKENVEQLRFTIRQLETTNEELKIQTEAAQKHNIPINVDKMKREYEHQLLDLKNKLDSQIVEAKTLKEQLDAEMSEKHRLTESIEMLNQTIRNLETDRTTLITDFEQTVKVVDARMQECKQLREQLSQQTALFDQEKKQWKNQMESFKNIKGSPSMDPIKKHESLKQEQEKIQLLQNDNAELLKKLNQVTEMNQELNNEKITLLDQLGQWQKYYEEQAQYNNYQMTGENENELKAKLLEYETLIQNLRKGSEDLVHELEEEKRKNVLLEAEVEALPDYISKYREERQNLMNHMHQTVAKIRVQTNSSGYSPSPLSAMPKSPTPLTSVPKSPIKTYQDTQLNELNSIQTLNPSEKRILFLHSQIPACHRCKEDHEIIIL